MILGCKTDNGNERTRIGHEEAQAFAQQQGGVYLETSSLDGTNISLAFTMLRMRVHRILKRKQEKEQKQREDAVSDTRSLSSPPGPTGTKQEDAGGGDEEEDELAGLSSIGAILRKS